MKNINVIFPHQLFEESPLFKTKTTVYLIEEYLFFKQYPFHKQKIAFHRATMKSYADFMQKDRNIEVHYIESNEEISDIRLFILELKRQGVEHISYIEPTDNWLQSRIEKSCLKSNISTTVYDSPLFLNTKEDLSSFFRRDKKKYHQTTFYTEQRKKRKILIDSDEKPIGGKWTFDTENRKKYPTKKTPPSIQFPDVNPYYEEAKKWMKIALENDGQDEGVIVEHYGDILYKFAKYEISGEDAEIFLDYLMTNNMPKLGQIILTPMLNENGKLIGDFTIAKEANNKFLIHFCSSNNRVERIYKR